ncbi:MAG: T9SS type A sorting domain-containing protein [Flavobacteriales bacterium]|nr:T9SS type A sorting domain-containing protein [Flavobacteriales bacterium]
MRTSSLLIAALLVPVLLTAQSFDATILSYEGLDRTCDGSITPVLRIQNTGGETMTSCDIDILRNGLADNTFNWVLAVPALTGEVRKPALPTITGLQPGDQLEFRITTVNTQPDEVATGNVITRTVQGESVEGDSYRVLVEVRTDGDPQETTWSLKDATGVAVASGGPYTNAETVERSWVDLDPAACYALRVDDSGGNGMDARALPGYVKVIALGEELIALDGAAFTSSYDDAVRTGADGCAVTQLTNADDAIPSCGTQVFLNGTSSIQARAVPGATHYQFQFSFGTYLRRIASTTPSLTLTPWATLPLKPGRIYEVQVRVSFDGAATYCPFGPACTIRTRYPLTATRDMEAMADEDAGFVLYPNPSDGSDITLAVRGMDGLAQVEVLDLSGRSVWQRSVQLTDEAAHALAFDGAVPAGLYIVRLTAGERTFTERLVLR